MFCLFTAPLAIFFELDFFRNKLFVFAGPVIDAFADAAGEFYKSVLRHSCYNIEKNLKKQLCVNFVQNRQIKKPVNFSSFQGTGFFCSRSSSAFREFIFPLALGVPKRIAQSTQRIHYFARQKACKSLPYQSHSLCLGEF